MPKLLDQVRSLIRLKHYSIRTEQAYLHRIRLFIVFHNKRHPSEMAEPEVTAFLSYLATAKNVSASTQTQALSAILFLYREVLDRPLERLDHLHRAKKSQRLPVVFTKDEAQAVLAQLDGTLWLMASLLYGSRRRARSQPAFEPGPLLCHCLYTRKPHDHPRAAFRSSKDYLFAVLCPSRLCYNFSTAPPLQ